MNTMTYRSPFGDIATTDHNGPDALCLSRTNCVNAVEETLSEFYEAAMAAIDRGAAQPSFFLARQLAELGLKAIHGRPARTHSLTELLDLLQANGDELLAGGVEQNLIVEFVRDVDSYDPRGDESRYPATLSGDPALAAVCCADPTLLREHVDRLHGYIQGRLAASTAATTAAVI
jgi:HEPN domain-containing protein